MTDIDTQIEYARTAFWEKMTSLVLEYDLHTFNPNIKEMERDLMNAYDEAIQTLLDTAVQEARIELATDLLRKVKLEYEAGGRYSGHIILPWEEIVRPELVKLKSTSKEDK